MSGTPERRSRRGTGVSKRDAKKASRKKQLEEQDPVLQRERMLQISRQFASQCSGEVINCDRGQNGYGIIFRAVPPTPAGTCGGVYINSVAHTSPSYSQRAKLISKRVVAVNGEDARVFSGQQLQSAVAQAVPPLVLVVSYDSDILDHYISTAYLSFECTLPGGHPGGFGLQVGQKPYDENDVELGTMFMVTAKTSGTAAALATSLRVGDTLVKINNYHLEGMMLSQVVDAMNSNSEKMEIHLRRRRQVVTFLIPRGTRGFGFRLAIVKDSRTATSTASASETAKPSAGVLVSDVTPASAADIAGLYVGYEVVRINGVATQGMTAVELVRCIASAEQFIELCTQPNTALLAAFTTERATALAHDRPAPPAAWSNDPRDVCVQRDANGSLGVSMGVVAATDTTSGGLVITAVPPAGPAWRADTSIRPGARVLALNGTPTAGLAMEGVVALLNTEPSATVTFTLADGGTLLDAYTAAMRTRPRASPKASNQRTVTLARETDAQAFGVVLGPARSGAVASDADRGVFLCGTQPDTPAARTIGADLMGQQVVQINGVGCREATLATALDVLATATDSAHELRLVLEKSGTGGTTPTPTPPPSVPASQPQDSGTSGTVEGASATVVDTSSAGGAGAVVQADTARVVLHRSSTVSSFGVRFQGAQNEQDCNAFGSGIFVSGVRPGTPAATNPDMRLEWQVVRIGEHDLRAGTIQDLRAVLAAVGDTLVLELQRNDALVQRYRTVCTNAPGRRRQALRGSIYGRRPNSSHVVSCILHKQSSDTSGFGVRLNGAKNTHIGDEHGFGVFVSGVAPGSPAEAASELHIGWQIVAVNGVDTLHTTIADIALLLRDTGDTVQLSLVENPDLRRTYETLRAQARSSTHGKAVALQSVRLQKQDGSFGIKFGGPRNIADAEKYMYGVYISGVKENSPAASNTDVRVGWQIVAMNGTDTSKATFVQLKGLLAECDDILDLRLQPNEVLRTTFDAVKDNRNHMRSSIRIKAPEVVVTLEKGDNGFGINFGGARTAKHAEEVQPGIFIAGIKPNTPAHEHPDVLEGLQIVSMNGTDLEHATFVDVKAVLTAMGDHMDLRLRENPALVAAFMVDPPPNSAPPAVASDEQNNADVGAVAAAADHRSDVVDDADGESDGNTDVRAGGAAHVEVKASEEEAATANGTADGSEGHSSAPDTVALTLVLDGTTKGFGISFGGARNAKHAAAVGMDGVYILDTKSGGVGARHPDMKVGWQIVSLNGTDMTTATHQDMRDTLRAVGTEMALVLRENEPLRLAHEKWKREAKARKEQTTDQAAAHYEPATSAEEASHTATNAPGYQPTGDVPATVSLGEASASESSSDAPSAVSFGAAGESSSDSQVSMALGSAADGESSSDAADNTADAMAKLWAINKTTACVRATLEKGDSGFGLKFGGAKDKAEADVYGYGMYIASVKPGTPAESNVNVRIGWQIVSVDGQDTSNATLVEMKEVVRSLGNTMTIEQVQNTQLAASYHDKKVAEREAKEGAAVSGDDGATLSCTIAKTKDGFGLSFQGPKNDKEAAEHGYGVYISEVKEGFPAAQQANVNKGWQIVSMNGVDVRSATFKDLKAILAPLDSVGAEMTLVLRENARLRATYDTLRAARRK
eukprot:m.1101559 g.1101559  ORF g.1101559 m.1101559 type:complete len:1624 (-) comp24325_c0_seq2:441-5312(-)